MQQLLWIAAGFVVALIVPRYRYAAPLAFAVVLSFTGTMAVLFGMQAPLILVAFALAVVPVVALILARALPWLFPPLMVLVGWGGVALTLAEADTSRLWAYVTLGIGVALAVLAIFRPPLGVRVFCAAIGARLMLAGTPWSTRWVFLVVTALLLLTNWIATLSLAPEPPTWGRIRRLAVVLVIWAFAMVMLLPVLASEVQPPAAEPYLSRWKRVVETAPQGGLIWPLPSWEAAGTSAFVENLDAQYLLGRQEGLLKLPGTSMTKGKLALHRTISRLRVIKDASEVEQLRAAAEATVAAVKESLPLFHSGKSEMEIARIISAGFKARGCERESFPLIVATGGNASILHHEAEPEAMLQHGQAVVADVGCYRGHYASDFTRTLPVGGKFQPQFRSLYEAVYQAQQAAAQACGPGMYLTGRGSPDGGSLEALSRAMLAARGVDNRYQHRIGHTVGLLVHDVPATGPLQEGMVITLEPGLYVDGELGIRIEDMYLVTDGGCELLTAGFPADPESVERMASEAFTPQDAGVVERILVPAAGVDGGADGGVGP